MKSGCCWCINASFLLFLLYIISNSETCVFLQARKLEAQLDEQMSSYRKLVASIADGSESDLESGIDQLLKQLQQVISHMQAWVLSGGSELFCHTLTRH